MVSGFHAVPTLNLKMRWSISASLVLILAGASLLIYSTRWPIYTDQNAPERLSIQLNPKGNLKAGESDARYKEWFSKLRTYETPRKRLSDLGRGVCASGFGLLIASGVWVIYHRSAWMRTTKAIFILWLILWAVRFPLTIWYYGLREQRFDYPIWADSIAIAIFKDWVAWAIGVAITSLVLAVLLKGYKFSDRIHLLRPKSVLGWFRATLLVLWIASLAGSLIYDLPDGDEGAVLTSIIASVVLLAFLSADEF